MLSIDLDKSKSYLVAFSGGADSALLAFLLKKGGYSFRLIHVNHGWSKASADADEIQEFCELWAKTYEVQITCESVLHELDPTYLKRYGTESAERRARYRIFERSVRPGEILLTGHHLDDSIETVLMNLCRGTSANGLTGISYDSSFSWANIKRPLVKAKKSEILSQCEAEAVLYRHDRMNDTDVQTRNFMRNKVMPLLVDRFGEQFYASLSRVMENMSECSEIIKDTYAIDFSSCKLDENRVWLGPFLKLSKARQRNFLYHFVSEKTGVFLTKNHINEVLKKLQVESVLRVNVGGVVILKAEDAYFYIARLSSS